MPKRQKYTAKHSIKFINDDQVLYYECKLDVAIIINLIIDTYVLL